MVRLPHPPLSLSSARGEVGIDGLYQLVESGLERCALGDAGVDLDRHLNRHLDEEASILGGEQIVHGLVLRWCRSTLGSITVVGVDLDFLGGVGLLAASALHQLGELVGDIVADPVGFPSFVRRRMPSEMGTHLLDEANRPTHKVLPTVRKNELLINMLEMTIAY